EFITATATDPANNTSEFSAALAATSSAQGSGCPAPTVPIGANFVVHPAFDKGKLSTGGGPAGNTFTTSITYNDFDCPGDTGETIRPSAGLCGGSNDSITQFPGDPVSNVPAAPNSLYVNGNNTFPVGGPAPYQPLIAWRQTVTGL